MMPESARRLRSFAASACPLPPVPHRQIAAAREEDSVTLWHLLFRVGGSDRRAVYARLLALSPERAASEAEAMSLDRTRLDVWFEELPSGDDD
jgi:hypothetical protein